MSEAWGVGKGGSVKHLTESCGILVSFPSTFDSVGMIQVKLCLLPRARTNSPLVVQETHTIVRGSIHVEHVIDCCVQKR